MTELLLLAAQTEAFCKTGAMKITNTIVNFYTTVEHEVIAQWVQVVSRGGALALPEHLGLLYLLEVNDVVSKLPLP